MLDVSKIRSREELLREARWLIGKTLGEVTARIRESDKASRALTKGDVGYVIEHGFFGIEKNSKGEPDIPHLGVEVKTCPLKYNATRDRLSIKEPLSLNIINYEEEWKHQDVTQSSFYKKNKTILFVLYLHDRTKDRSSYVIRYVFYWEMDEGVLDELRPDYIHIVQKILQGKAHEIHQGQHQWLTLCPKHNGNYKDPACKISKRPQPFSDVLAEVRAYRLKAAYMNLIVCRQLGKALGRGGWKDD